MIQLYSLTQKLHGLQDNRTIYMEQIQDLKQNIENADTDFLSKKKPEKNQTLQNLEILL